MSDTAVRMAQHRYTPLRGRIVIPFLPETPLGTYPPHHADNLRAAPWAEMTWVKYSLGCMRRYGNEQWMRREGLDEVFDQEMILELEA